jgi:hypothetical protein
MSLYGLKRYKGLDEGHGGNWPRAAYTRLSAAKLLRKLAKTLMVVQDPEPTFEARA